MNEIKRKASPTRHYVMICDSGDFKSVYFKHFYIPQNEENSIEFASWYFFNRLDFFSCSSKGCITFEDYSNLNEVSA